MNLLTRMAASAAEKETPRRRQFELKVISVDCFGLMLGCFGLAIAFPPVVYVAAAAHLACGFLLAFSKVVWLIGTAVTVAAASVIFVGGEYLGQVYYWGFPGESFLYIVRHNWPHYLAKAIVAAGIVGTLFSYPGALSELVE